MLSAPGEPADVDVATANHTVNGRPLSQIASPDPQSLTTLVRLIVGTRASPGGVRATPVFGLELG